MNTIKVDGTGDPESRIASLEQAVNYGEVILPFPVVGEAEGGGTGGTPTGPAGGDLTGTYPNPTIRAGVLGYRHVQATATTVWTIAHNLPFRPNVAAVDSTGREMWPGALDYPDAVTVQLTFSAAVGGEAYLS